MGQNQETIIIGGGCAGMYAAIKLQEAGLPYTLMTDRMGGRIMYREEFKSNFSAIFTFGNYHHMLKILKSGPKVLPSLRAGMCHLDKDTQYPALGLRTARHFFQLRRFQTFMKKEFLPHYEIFKTNCETMQVKDALKKDPFMQDLFYMTADQLLTRLKIQKIAELLISQFAHACTGCKAGALSALDYLNCVQGLVLELRLFTFDENAMATRLRGGQGNVLFDAVLSVGKNSDGTYAVETKSGKTYTTKNVVLATPADVTVGIVKTIVRIPKIRNASPLRVYYVRGRMKQRYQNPIVHIFADHIPIIFTLKYSKSEWIIYAEKEIDLSEYYEKYEIAETVYWPKSLFTDPNIVLDQDLAENLYMAGDHNGLGMEPAAISGIYAANQIIKKSKI